jgi:hypothetical protein
MPAEIVGTCDSIYQDALFIKSLKPDFNIQLVRQNLGALLRGFRQDVDDPKPRRALKALNELNFTFAEMDRLGVQIGYITRLKLEQAAIRKTLLRFYYIQRINFLPSAYLLVESIIVLIITLLILSRIDPLIDALVVIGFISYIFVYIMMLLRVLEKPFQKEGRTMDDVSLFLMEEMQELLEKEGNKT